MIINKSLQMRAFVKSPPGARTVKYKLFTFSPFKDYPGKLPAIATDKWWPIVPVLDDTSIISFNRNVPCNEESNAARVKKYPGS